MNTYSITGFRKRGSILTAMLAIFLLSSPVWAATIVVDETTEVDNSSCSLREAIIAANTDAAVDSCVAGDFGADTITLPAGTYTLSIDGTGEDLAATGDLDINADLTINGDGAASTIIEGDGNDRVFHVASGSILAINNVTITKGDVEGDGGGIFNDGGTLTLTGSTISYSISNGSLGSTGGGIYNNNGTLTLIGSTISICRARSGTGMGYGGGIYNLNGTVSLTDGSTIADNTAELGAGAGIYNDGGTVILNNSTVRDNVTNGHGGGIYSFNGAATITDSTVINNFAVWYGGGIYNDGGTMTLTDSTIDGNTADVYGGGLSNWGTAILNNSTISNNTASSNGGGIYNDNTLYANNITISGNSGDTGGGIYQSTGQMELYNATISNNMTTMGTGGGIYITAGVFNVFNSIIAGNTDGSATAHHDCDGTILSGGYNLIQDTTGCTGTVGTDITGSDPLLSVLADNGGSTTTHALQSGSPAIDAGDPTGCVDANVDPLTTDQRGVSRPQDGDGDSTARCDIGAYEFALPPDINVTDSISPADNLQIDFGEVQNGSSSTEVIITLANQGHQSLTVSNVVVNGAEASLFSIDFSAGAAPCNGLSIVIAGGQNCTLGVTFAPQSVGAKSASVDISSDDPDEGTINVTLSGTGISPPADDTPAPASGGCTLSSNRPFDPLIPLMIGVALLYLARSRGKVSRHK